MSKNEFLLSQTLKAMLPIVPGYILIGLFCGAVLHESGFNTLEIAIMSLSVYAGGAQFIAASLLASGVAFSTIILTTFIVNIRHFLMSFHIASHVKTKNKIALWFMAHGTTDETFAMNSIQFEDGNWSDKNVLLFNIISCLLWAISTFLGAAFSARISFSSDIANFAMTALFVCLLIGQLKNMIYLVVAVVAAMISFLILQFSDNNIFIIIAAIVASFVGYILESSKPIVQEEDL